MKTMRSVFSVFLALALVVPVFGMFTSVSAAPADVVNENPLYQKSALFVGDSICEAYCEWNTTGGLNYSGWAGRIFSANSMTGVNLGKSGASMSTCRGTNTVINQLIAQNGNKYDYIIIEGGANDAWDACTVGTMASGFDASFDVATFAGGLETTFKYAKENFPDAILGYIITFQMPSANYGKLADMSEYVAVSKQICNKWEVPYIDLYNDQDFNDNVLKSATTTYLPDYIHPNAAGYDILAPRINAWMKTLGVEVYNLALGKNYTISGSGVGYEYDDPNYGYALYQADLNDGVASQTGSYDNEWFGFYVGSAIPEINTVNGVGTVTMDLEKLSNITYIRANILNTEGMPKPSYSKVLVSTNGTDYTEAGELSTVSTEGVHWIDLSKAITARYVKFEFGVQWPFLFINEIEIYGSVAEASDGNIAAYKSYTIQDGTKKGFYFQYENGYIADYSANLTDTAATDNQEFSNQWFGFYQDFSESGSTVNNTLKGIGTVVINLEDVYTLNNVQVHLWNNDGANAPAPLAIKASVSTDNVNFTEVGSLTTTTTNNTTYWATLDVANKDAQFLKLEFTLGSYFCMLNEIKAYGTYKSEGIHVNGGNQGGSSLVNVAYQKDYTISGCGSGYYFNDPEYGIVQYQADLTDEINSDLQEFNNGWFGFYCGEHTETVNTVNGIGTIIIDLEADYDITQVRVHMWNCNGANLPAPKSVKISLSTDKSSFIEAGALNLNTDDNTVHWSKAEFTGKGRYVKLDFELKGMFCMLNEIHVYGTPSTNDGGNQGGEEHTHSAIDNTWSSDANGHWHICSCNEKVDAGSHDSGEWYITENAKVGVEGKKELRCTVCGYVLKTEKIPALEDDHVHAVQGPWISDEKGHWRDCACGEDMEYAEHSPENVEDENGETVTVCITCGYVKEETEVALGDVNKSGAIDMMDYILLKRNYFGTFNFDDAQLKAGDVNKSGAIDMMDYVLLKRVYFGTFTLQ